VEDPKRQPNKRPALSVSPDGRYLAWLEQRLLLYEVASGRVVHAFPAACTAAAFHPSRLRLAAAHAEWLDTLVWDLPSLFLALPAGVPDRPGLGEWWADLGGADAGRAHRALWRLAGAEGMEALLAGEMKPAARIDRAWLDRQIADLGSDDYAARQKAEKALAPLVEATQEVLRQAYRRTQDLEQRLRLRRLLARLKSRSPEQLRHHRAVLALEGRATPAAQRLLSRLARGMPGAPLTEEAKAALERLPRSPGRLTP
jgi:hypothetical protein